MRVKRDKKEQELILRLIRREESALMEFIGRYDSLLAYIVRPIVKDERDVEECLSDIHYKIWEHIQNYSPEKGSFSTWLSTVARNTAMNKIRGKANREDVPLEEETVRVHSEKSVEQQVIRREQTEYMQRLIRNLPSRERELFYRKYYYYQSVEQIAAELGTSRRSVEGKLYRIRKKLQTGWKEAHFDEKD